MNKLPISPKKAAIILGVITVCLAILSVAGQYYTIHGGDHPFYLKAAEKLNLDGKHNFPTWLKSSLMLLSSFLLAIIAFARYQVQDVGYRFWKFFSFVFLYMSVDEQLCIHQQLVVPLRQTFHLHGIFFLAWVIPFGLVTCLIFAWSLKYLWSLPARARWLMIIAGCIFVGGAVGMEMIDGAYYEKHIEPFGNLVDMTYVLMTTVEESLEIIGLTVFIYTLLSYLGSEAIHAAPATVTEKSLRTLKPKIILHEPAAVQMRVE